MYNTFIPIATLPLPVVRSSASRLLAPLCQNRQASTNSYVSCTSRCPGDAGPFVRTDKQAPTDQGLQAYCYITNSGIAVCCWDLDALGNFCQNRQASSYPQVVHSLWLVIHRLRQNKEAAHWISKGFGPCFFERGPRALVPGPYGFCF